MVETYQNLNHIQSEYGPIMLIVFGILIGSCLHSITAIVLILIYISIKNTPLPEQLGGLTPQLIFYHIILSIYTQIQKILYNSPNIKTIVEHNINNIEEPNYNKPIKKILYNRPNIKTIVEDNINTIEETNYNTKNKIIPISIKK